MHDALRSEAAVVIAVATRLREHEGPRRKQIKVQRRQETLDRWLNLWAPHDHRAALTAILPQDTGHASIGRQSSLQRRPAQRGSQI